MVFFPLGELSAKKSLLPVQDRMKDSLKLILLDDCILENTINLYSDTIKDINAINWHNIKTRDATPNFTCEWCDYRGTYPREEGYEGCPASMRAFNHLETRKTKVLKEGVVLTRVF
jgi:hypothetical protein